MVSDSAPWVGWLDAVLSPPVISVLSTSHLTPTEDPIAVYTASPSNLNPFFKYFASPSARAPFKNVSNEKSICNFLQPGTNPILLTAKRHETSEIWLLAKAKVCQQDLSLDSH